MHTPKGKTKTAMLLELESIKGLLVEEDGIPILQEVIAEEIPVLDMIVPPEELPEEAIPLLVSVVVDDNALNDSTPVFQPQFATQDEAIPNWTEPSLETDLSLTVEIPEEAISLAIEIAPEEETFHAPEKHSDEAAEVQPELITPLARAPETEPGPQDVPELFPGGIPTLTESEKDRDSLGIAAQAVEENPEVITAAAISTPPDIPQHRTEQQQDFFQVIEENPSEPLSAPAPANRPTPVKPAGENPFLPEHIRARLQSNNAEAQTGDIHSKRFKALSLGSIHNPSQTANKPSPIQQQLINEVMDKMLPEMAKELRARLEQMSKKMLEELLAEHKS